MGIPGMGKKESVIHQTRIFLDHMENCGEGDKCSVALALELCYDLLAEIRDTAGADRLIEMVHGLFAPKEVKVYSLSDLIKNMEEK